VEQQVWRRDFKTEANSELFHVVEHRATNSICTVAILPPASQCAPVSWAFSLFQHSGAGDAPGN